MEKMKVELVVKKPSEFFWLRKIKGVDLTKCCAECFIGDKENSVYYSTYEGRTPCEVTVNMMPSSEYVAYYICGLAKDFNYKLNTHIAFVYAEGETLEYENEQVKATVTNARFIDFENADYTPDPLGTFTKKQRICRNWIFANYIRDGLLN